MTPTAAEPTGDQPHRRPGPVTEVCRAANRLRQHLDHTVLRAVGLNWTSFDLLQLTVASGEIDTRTAAATAGVSKATITQVVRGLARRNLLRRGLAPGDQRRVVLRPTSTGWHLIHDLRTQITTLENDLLRHGVADINGPATTVLRAVATRHPAPESTPTRPHPVLPGDDHS